MTAPWTVDENVKNTVGWIAVVSVIGLFLSPMKDIWGPRGVYRTKSTVHLATCLPYFATFFNCLLWTIAFAGDSEKLQPFVVNVFGALVSGSYASCFWFYDRQSAEARRNFIAGCVITAAAIILWVATSNQHDIAYVAAGVNVVMYYSPLGALGEVVRTKSVARMPFSPLLMTFIGSCLWLSYGIYSWDFSIVIPNVIGVILGVIQLSVYGYYSRSKIEPEYTALDDGEEDFSNVEASSHQS